MPGGYMIGEGGSPDNTGGAGFAGTDMSTRVNMSDVKLPLDAKDDLPSGNSYADLEHEDVGQHTQHVGKIEAAGDSMTPQNHQSMDHQEVNVAAQNVTRSVTAGRTGQSGIATLDHKTVHMGNLGKGERKTSRG